MLNLHLPSTCETAKTLVLLKILSATVEVRWRWSDRGLHD